MNFRWGFSTYFILYFLLLFFVVVLRAMGLTERYKSINVLRTKQQQQQQQQPQKK